MKGDLLLLWGFVCFGAGLVGRIGAGDPALDRLLLVAGAVCLLAGALIGALAWMRGRR
jgi:hypothetical protein